jgi:hypothetical protein
MGNWEELGNGNQFINVFTRTTDHLIHSDCRLGKHVIQIT